MKSYWASRKFIFKARGAAWLPQSIRCLTLDLSPGLALRVLGLSPILGSTLDIGCGAYLKKKSAWKINILTLSDSLIP